MTPEFFLSVGGRALSFAAGTGEPIWNFGWSPPETLPDEAQAAHHAAVGRMPRFEIQGDPHDDVEAADLTKLWSHPTVVAALGRPYTGTHQLTGSCVGAGGGNVAASLSFVEVILKGDPERCILPFYPYTYGKSRERSGMRGRGEGSTGSGWAEAAIKDGVIDNKLAGLPQPTGYDDGIIWGKDVELSWSDGTRIDGKWIEEGRRHLIQTAAECKSAADVRRAIANGYPVTCASMYAHRPSVEDGILLGRRQGQWSHQMSIHAFLKHPRHGVVYWLHNQWGLRVHGTCPTGMPGGGVWITEADVDWICRTGEVYAFSQYNGYPSQSLDWSLI